MSMRLTKLQTRAFRGVPTEMTLDLPRGTSIIVFGENGTGKSTVADALEWYFTGRIEALAHEGRDHAIRHIGSEDSEATEVVLETTGRFAGKYRLNEKHQAPRPLTEDTFLLRGRGLAEFVEKTKSEKWKELSKILGFSAVDEVGTDLQRAVGELKRSSEAATQRMEAALAGLSALLPEVGEQALWDRIIEVAGSVGLSPDTLDSALDPEWLRDAGYKDVNPRSDLARALHQVRTLRSPELDFSAWNSFISSLDRGTSYRLRILDLATKLDEELGHQEACPLCRQPVSPEHFSAEIRRELTELRELAGEFEKQREAARGMVASLAGAWDRREEISKGIGRVKLPILPPRPPIRDLEAAVVDGNALDAESTQACVAKIQEWDDRAAVLIEKTHEAIPPRADSIGELAVLCERGRAWREASDRVTRLARAVKRAEALLKAYRKEQRKMFEATLERISTRTQELYSRLHPGEPLDDVTIETWKRKGVELAITFYGVRQKPPHGVLSESHLNSLAIAVFLAMAETFNRDLGFLVLDDVVNSFDVSHRRALAEVLAEEFEDWQLIVLTHDRRFFEMLRRLAPSWEQLELTSWSYDEGPRPSGYCASSLYDEAERALEAGDVGGAAMKCRRALEETLQEACQGLQAPLPFCRGLANDRREVGQLLSGLRSLLKSKCKSYYNTLTPRFAAIEADVAACLNPEVHVSPGSVSKPEVRGAIDRAMALDGEWTCPKCQRRKWDKGTVEAASCRCGMSRFPPNPDEESQEED